MKMLALLGTLRPIAIITAPAIGGFLGAVFGWRRVFIMLSCWGLLNLTLSFALLPETLRVCDRLGDKEGFCSHLWSGVRRVADNTQSLSLIVSLTLLFAAPACMLSNIAFVLDGCGLSQQRASLLIGSIPCTMILGSLVVGLLGGKSAPPIRILRFGMVSVLCASGVGLASAYFSPAIRTNWIYSMVPFYCLVFSQSLCGPPGMAMYLTPWGKDAGLASGLMSLARASVPSLLAIVSTNVTQKYGPAGLLDVISIILVATNLVFGHCWGSEGITTQLLLKPTPPLVANRNMTGSHQKIVIWKVRTNSMTPESHYSMEMLVTSKNMTSSQTMTSRELRMKLMSPELC